MITGFFGGAFFGGGFFGAPTTGRPDDGGRGIIKPTGLDGYRPRREDEALQKRLQESADDALAISERLAREFAEENAVLARQTPIVSMTLKEIDREIGILLRRKLKTEEDDVLLLTLMAASA